MTRQSELLQLIFTRTLWKRALAGAGIGLLMVLILLTIVGAINDGSWIFVPMLTVAISGACGGAFYHVVSVLRIEEGWKRVLAYALSAVVFLIGLWLGLVYGLSLVGLWD